MVTPQMRNLILQLFKQSGVYNAGVTVIFHNEHRLVRANGVKLVFCDQMTVGNGVWGSAEAHNEAFLVLRKVFSQHIEDFGVAARLHDVQPGVECCKGGKMYMRIRKGGNKRAL